MIGWEGVGVIIEAVSLVNELRPTPVSQRQSSDAVQKLALETSLGVINASAEVLQSVTDALDWTAWVHGDLDTMVSAVHAAAGPLARAVEAGRPRLRAIDHYRLTAIPPLDPWADDRLRSVTTWHDRLLGTVLDLSDAGRAHAELVAVPGGTPPPKQRTAELLVLGLQGSLVLTATRTAHEQLQQAMARTAFDVGRAEPGVAGKALREVEADRRALARRIASACDSQAQTLEDLLDPPTGAARLQRGLGRLLGR